MSSKPRLVNLLVFFANLALVFVVLICLAVWYYWEDVPDISKILQMVGHDDPGQLDDEEEIFIACSELGHLFPEIASQRRPVGQPTEPVWAWLNESASAPAFTFDFGVNARWRIVDLEKQASGETRVRFKHVASNQFLACQNGLLRFADSAEGQGNTRWTIVPVPGLSDSDGDEASGDEASGDEASDKLVTHALGISQFGVQEAEEEDEETEAQFSTCQIMQDGRFLTLVREESAGRVILQCGPARGGLTNWLLIRAE